VNPRWAIFVVLSLVASATQGEPGATGAAGRLQRGGSTSIHFAVEESAASWATVPGSSAAHIGQGYPGEDYPLVYCGWPSDRTSISVADAKAFRCSPSGVGLSVPAPGAFEVLSSPIGDKWPETQSGGLSRELRFVKRRGNVLEVGPDLMDYGDYSGGARPSFDEADGWLWIFDDRTEHGPEVIRVSTKSGEVRQRTAMPPISRPIVGANVLGFWMAQDSVSAYPTSGVRLGVWFAGIGTSKSLLVKASGGGAWALRADGTSMDVFISPRLPAQKPAVEVWRFTPRNARVN
jgi:hypothetical protein